MSKGTMHQTDNLPEETIFVQLVNLPRVKLDVIRFTGPQESHLLLRRMKYFGPGNVQCVEIKIGIAEAKKLYAALASITGEVSEIHTA